MRFYLGTHMPSWLAKTDVPLFLSRRRLARVKHLPKALGPYAIDSGGFSELSMFGTWKTTASQYVDEVRRFRDEIGPMDFAVIRDFMCEPAVRAKTGLSVEEHQRRTVESFIEFRDLAPEIPWCPVLQGWVTADYLRHVEAHEQAGIDLRAQPVVGVGSVCRRQDTTSAQTTLFRLALEGFSNLHGFGFKTKGLDRVGHVVALGGRSLLASADSLAWSFSARRQRGDGTARLTDCEHASESNCLDYALAWRSQLLAKLDRTKAA